MNTPKTTLIRRGNGTLRLDPFEAVGMPTPFGRLFDAFARDPFFGEVAERTDMDTLAIDLSETDDAVKVRASLPGFRRDEVNLEIEDGVLRIEAHKSEATEEATPTDSGDQTEGTGETAPGRETWIRRERRETSLTRTVTLPTAVDQDSATAELLDGVLTLTLPKAQVSTRRRIEIGN